MINEALRSQIGKSRRRSWGLEVFAMELLEQQIQFLKHVRFSTPESERKQMPRRKVAAVELSTPEIVVDVDQADNSTGRLEYLIHF